jgi:integrase
LQDYRHLINRHVRPHIGELRLQAVTPARITKLYRDLMTRGGRNGTGLSHRTVTYVHAVLRKAFRDAVVVEQLLPSNPIERAKRPRKTAAEPGTVWHPGQLAAFLATAQGHRLFAFYHLAAYTGARRGELLNLRWRDIDLDAPQIDITGWAAVIAGKRIEGTTKSGRSRTISLDADTVQVLKDHRKRQAQDQLTAGPEWKGTDDYVFRTAWGKPIHPGRRAPRRRLAPKRREGGRTTRLTRSALDVGQALRHLPGPDPQQVCTADMPVRPAVEPPDDDPITRAEHLLHLKMRGW